MLTLAGNFPVVASGDAGHHTVWWEGEDTLETNFPEATRFSAVTFPDSRDLLSDGDWLTNHGPATDVDACARYMVEIPADGMYYFWVRKFWKQGPFRWRFGDGDWRRITHAHEPTGAVPLRPYENGASGDPYPGLEVNWFYAGRVELSEGSHEFELRLLGTKRNTSDPHGQDLTAGLDAFFLTSDDRLVPAFNTQPEPPSSSPGPADWFPVTFREDDFSKDSVIDLSHLVEAPAGKYGHLKQIGNRLQFENADEPVQFWGCGANYLDLSREETIQRIRYLRKHGVRIVRQHPLQSMLGPLRGDGTFDPEKLDRWDWWFAQLKEHGIYMDLGLFYPHHIHRDEGYDLFDELPKAAY
ncbi:MAG: hypothetical protein DRP71_07135 [Verrucomicrobia bacterium]|nr:MAG: hypothetical protein DRP71_07135 [Verrucomicrobiota bacterium]